MTTFSNSSRRAFTYMFVGWWCVCRRFSALVRVAAANASLLARKNCAFVITVNTAGSFTV